MYAQPQSIWSTNTKTREPSIIDVGHADTLYLSHFHACLCAVFAEKVKGGSRVKKTVRRWVWGQNTQATLHSSSVLLVASPSPDFSCGLYRNNGAAVAGRQEVTAASQRCKVQLLKKKTAPRSEHEW